MKSTLFTESHKEIQSDSFLALQNESLLRVHLKEERELIARRGSVIASQGEIGYANVFKAEDNERDVPLLKARGEGNVFVADHNSNVHLIILEDEGLVLNGDYALAFDARLRYEVKQSRIPQLPEFWKIHISGSGPLALTTKGSPVLLRTDNRTIRADLGSTIAWSSSLTPQVKPSIRLGYDNQRNDRFYFSFSGDGWVLVQPGE